MIDLVKLKQRLTNPEIVGLTIYGEGRNQSIDGRIAIGSVIRNRLFSKENYGGPTYKDICLAPHQFSCWFKRGENYDELEKAVEKVTNEKMYGHVLLRECLFLGLGITDNHLRDNVYGATYYRTIKSMREDPVKVAWSMELGDHIFYKIA